MRWWEWGFARGIGGVEGGLTGKEEESPCGAEEEEWGFIGDGGGVGVCAVPGCYCCESVLCAGLVGLLGR